jgi:glucose/mannose-6-phosphate isomerase
MPELIAELPAQLRWAADVDVPAMPSAEEALVAGMGGSGIAGGIAAVVAASEGRRVSVHRSYGLPGWAERVAPALIAVSHSGNTEETLDTLEAAGGAGLDRALVTTGGRVAALGAETGLPLLTIPPGPQPRAAIGYLAGAVLRLLEAAEVLPPQRAALLEAADVVQRLLGDGDGPGPALAADLADALVERVVVIYGGVGVAAVAGNRWKTQINENGKAMAYWSELPELDHNEIVGWTAWPGLGRDRVGVVFLHDAGDHPRITLRARLTRDLIEDLVGIAGEVHSQGESVLARIFSLVVMGDLVSVAVAEQASADPMPVAVIEDLKARLALEET